MELCPWYNYIYARTNIGRLLDIPHDRGEIRVVERRSENGKNACMYVF
jgi:hypothetical protein